MFNLFKSTKIIELKEVFIIGDKSFTIDKSTSTIEVVKDKLIELTLKTSESEFEKAPQQRKINNHFTREIKEGVQFLLRF